GKRELRVRSMNAANVAMCKAAFGPHEHFPERPVTGHLLLRHCERSEAIQAGLPRRSAPRNDERHAAFRCFRFASCATAASRTQAPLYHVSRRAFIRSLAPGPAPRTAAVNSSQSISPKLYLPFSAFHSSSGSGTLRPRKSACGTVV